MSGVTEGGLFNPTMPFPSLGTPDMGRGRGSSSSGGNGGGLDFKDLFEERGTIDRKVSGTNAKTYQYYQQLAEYDKAVQAVTMKNLMLFTGKHGGNRASFYQVDGQSMYQELAYLTNMKADLNYKAAIIAKENTLIEQSDIKNMSGDTYAYDMNGKIMTFKGPDGEQIRITKDRLMSSYNRIGFESDKDTGQPIMFEGYKDVSSEAYDNIISKVKAQIGNTSIHAGDNEGTFVLNEDQTRKVYEESLDLIMADPEARRYFLRNYYDDQERSSYKFLGTTDILKASNDFELEIDKKKEGLKALSGREKEIAKFEIASLVAEKDKADKEILKRDEIAKGTWNENDELNEENQKLGMYKRNWVTTNASMASSRYINMLSEDEKAKKTKKKLIEAIPDHPEVLGEWKSLSVPTSEVNINEVTLANGEVLSDKILMHNRIQDVVDKKTFIEKDLVKIKEFVNKHDVNNGTPINYKPKGHPEGEYYIEIAQDQASRGYNIFARENPFTKINDSADLFLVKKDKNGKITKRIKAPIQEIILMNPEMDINNYLSPGQSLEDGSIASYVLPNKKVTMGKNAQYVQVPRNVQKDMVGGQGLEFYEGDFEIISPVAGRNGKFNTPVPFEGHIVRVNSVFQDVIAFKGADIQYPDGSTAPGENSNGSAQGVRMLVTKRQMEKAGGFVNKEGNEVSWADYYKDNLITPETLNDDKYPYLKAENSIYNFFLAEDISPRLAYQLQTEKDGFYLIDMIIDNPFVLEYGDREVEEPAAKAKVSDIDFSTTR
jgi:hypothetical protein